MLVQPQVDLKLLAAEVLAMAVVGRLGFECRSLYLKKEEK